MKKKFLVLLTVIVMCMMFGNITNVTAAASGTCGTNLKWTYENQTLTISGSGSMQTYSSVTAVPWYSYRSNIKKLVIGEDVTSISKNAFYCFTYLEEIYWNAKKISAFYSNNYNFYQAGRFDDGISLVFGDKVESIPSYAFYPYQVSNSYLPYIKSVTFGTSIKSIGSYAFYGCNDLKTVQYKGDEASWNNITISSYNTNLTNAKRYYSDMTWSLDNSGILTISGTGDMIEWESYKDVPWYSNSYKVNKVVINEGVTNVSPYAFYYCYNLTDVTIPKSVKSIEKNAFSGCSKLTSVALPNGVETIGDSAFNSCSQLSTITLPESVTTIGDNAFNNCKSLTSVTIPKNVTSIGNYVFQSCTNITNISLCENLTSIGDSAFSNCSSLEEITIPKNVTNIGTYAFSNCSNLTDITLSENLESLSNRIFNGCKSLSQITIPNNVTTIGEYAFSDCSSLSGITLSDNVTTIGASAFNKCSSLSGIDIPANLESIGTGAFSECSSLKAINVDSKNIYFSSVDGVLFNNDKTELISCPMGKSSESFEIPASVTKIADKAFYNCNSLTNIVISDNVGSIGSYAFYNCSSLTDITIGKNVTSIGSLAFGNCTMLNKINWNAKSVSSLSSNTFSDVGQNTDGVAVVFDDSVEIVPSNIFEDTSKIKSITLGKNVKKIGSYAFYGLTDVSEIEFPDTMEIIGNYAFYGCTGLTEINLPDSITSIGSYAFYGCSGLKEIKLPSKLTAIEQYTFNGCNNLVEITIPSNVTNIGNYVFSGCINLKNINVDTNNQNYVSVDGVLFDKEKTTLILYPAGNTRSSYIVPDGITTIYDEAFKGNTYIKNVSLPNGLVTLGYRTFSGCSNLLSIVVPKTVTSYPSYVFENCTNLVRVEYYGSYYKLDGNMFKGCTNLQTVIAPNITSEVSNFKNMTTLKTIEIDRVSTIDDYAFSGCTNLETVICAAYDVGEYAFNECDKLKKFFVGSPYGTCKIGKYAFYSCDSLYEVSIPANLSLSDYAFSSCSNLKNIYISTYSSSFNYNNSISSKAFSGVTATVYYPKGINLNAYDCNYGNYGGTLTWSGVDYGTCAANVYWQYDESTHTLTLYGSGNINTAWSSGDFTPWSYLQKNIYKISVQNGITKIDMYTFEYMENVEEIILPDTLKFLAYNAFNDCYKLNNLIIPASLESFNDSYYGFNRCNLLTDVYYVGTKEEFEKIPNYSGATQNGQKIHFLVWNKSSATCTKSGVEGYYSFDDTSVYDTKYDKNKKVVTTLSSVPATGHNIEWMDEIPATCHETGKKERFECKNCGVIYNDKYGSAQRQDAIIEINPDNHMGETELRDVADGFTGNLYCLGCEQIIEKGESIYKIKISGTSDAVIGSSDIVQTVEVGTNKDVNALYCFIKYPETLTLKSVTAKDFVYAELEDEYTEDGFTTAIILAQYSETELMPKNEILTPFELTFDVSKSALPGTIEIEATEESCLIGNETYFFEERIPGTLEILPKLAESIEISGADVISSETAYTAIVNPDYTTDKSVNWSVDNQTIATVNENGIVTPVTSGTITLIATAKDGSGVLATKQITITCDITNIEIVGADSITEATTYIANITPDYATNKEVEWSISNEEIATIDQQGRVTPVTSGLVIVTATAKDGSGVVATKEINIKKLAETIEITGEESISSPSQYTAIVLPDYTSDKDVSWSIDNEEIATVDELGIVTPVTSGTVILTAAAKDGSGAFATKTIEIVKFAQSIEIVGSEEITEPTQYNVVILPEYTTNKDAKWFVSDEQVATVDENGVVTPLKNGKIVLTAKAEDASGIETTKSIIITVSVRANSITSDVGIWDKEFDSDITEYTINVPVGTTAIYLTSSFTNATAKVNGTIAANGVRKKVSLTGNETNVEIVLTPTSGNNLKANTYTIKVVCGSFTKTTVSQDGKLFTVTPINIETGKTVIVALYNEKQLVEMQNAIYTGETISFTTDKTYTTAKIMVWDDLTTLKPVCSIEELN